MLEPCTSWSADYRFDQESVSSLTKAWVAIPLLEGAANGLCDWCFLSLQHLNASECSVTLCAACLLPMPACQSPSYSKVLLGASLKIRRRTDRVLVAVVTLCKKIEGKEPTITCPRQLFCHG